MSSSVPRSDILDTIYRGCFACHKTCCGVFACVNTCYVARSELAYTNWMLCDNLPASFLCGKKVDSSLFGFRSSF